METLPRIEEPPVQSVRRFSAEEGIGVILIFFNSVELILHKWTTMSVI